jgi:xylose isomerase
MELIKHHYDFDSTTVIGFLHHYGLEKDLKMSIAVNHAIHIFQHEIEVASKAGMLGSLGANRGDHQNGWIRLNSK